MNDIDKLIDDYLDERISDKDAVRLRDAISSDDSAMDRFIFKLDMHAALSGTFKGGAEVKRLRRYARRKEASGSLAGFIMAAVGVAAAVAIFFLLTTTEGETPREETQVAQTPDSAPPPPITTETPVAVAATEEEPDDKDVVVEEQPTAHTEEVAITEDHGEEEPAAVEKPLPLAMNETIEETREDKETEKPTAEPALAEEDEAPADIPSFAVVIDDAPGAVTLDGRRAARGATVAAGAVIRTGRMPATVKTLDMNTIIIGPNSELRLEEIAAVTVDGSNRYRLVAHLSKGIIEGHILPVVTDSESGGEVGPLAKITTPNGTVSVTGTSFVVEATKDKSVVSVRTGKAAFSEAGRVILLSAGQAAFARAGKAPPSPAEIDIDAIVPRWLRAYRMSLPLLKEDFESFALRETSGDIRPWQRWSIARDGDSVRISNEVAHSGSRSIRVSKAKGANWQGFGMRFPCNPDRPIEVSFWVKASRPCTINTQLSFGGPFGKTIGLTVFDRRTPGFDVNAGTGWTHVTETFMPPEGSPDWMGLYIKFDKKDETFAVDYWVDDIVVRNVGKRRRNR